MWPFRKKPDAVEERSLVGLPWVPFTVGGLPAQTVTQSRALSLGPVYAANRFLGDAISTLPVHGFRDAGDQRLQMTADPQLIRLLRESGGLQPWLYEMVTSLGLRGNAVGLIVATDGLGFATAVVWLPMDDVRVDDGGYPNSQWYYKGRRVDRSEIVHVPWFKLAGRTLGLSPIEAFALTVNTGLGAQEYAGDWFRAGGVPPGTFQNSEQTVTELQANEIRARLVRSIRTHEPLVYGRDWSYNPVVVPPEQAQFVEAQNLSANQVAAIYGIAPEEVGGVPANSLTYNTEELRQTRRMSDLRPWLVRIESALTALLPERQYVKFNADAVIRADLKSRHEVYKIDREIGLRSINEIRQLEELPPVPGGDEVAPPKPPAPPQPAPPPDGADASTDDAVRSNGHMPTWATIQ